MLTAKQRKFMIFKLYFRIEKSLLKLPVAALKRHIGIAVIITRNWLNRKSMTELIRISLNRGLSHSGNLQISGLDFGWAVLRTKADEDNLGHSVGNCIL